ncbi:MAG: acyl CoA:acetate/3-ketoacid CoA transferase [Candidatus Hydrogenedens sp.]|nr:acyl CoA:acetate/3-ketoacid CoA transferase [Candidatus Hydrogenedentota bacterium]NLF56138.1 acyl CoA:acetate/3-ketoacid CoA transferase [Candidatus Hydrogenedens sp.]
MARVVSADEAVKLIPDGASVLVVPMPSEEIYPAFHRVYEETGSPKDLTFIWAAGLGPFSAERKGMNHFAYEGMTRRIIAGHLGLNHEVMKLIVMNQVEAYNLPQGVMCQLYREMAAGRPGLITRVGLGTFADPRIDGGKLNERTMGCEDLVELIEVGGREMLLYKSLKADVCLVRGTTADPSGNITHEDEAICMENLEGAMAVKNSGGFVIAQVERLLDGPAKPHDVRIPGIFVDYVVVAQSRQNHPHTLFVEHDPSYTGEERVDLESEFVPMPLTWEKVLCRRAFMELRAGNKVNLGVGIPLGVAQVAHEEGMLGDFFLNTEVGVIGGLPQGGKNFGPAKNPSAFMSQASMFDFYDGGGLDITCLGMAQVDREGNVNVSKLGNKIIGSGGFVNITQATKEVIFCGEFSAVGAQIHVENGGLRIAQEGRVAKFVDKVEQITFSGRYAREEGHKVLYVTERGVFKLDHDGLALIEIAPGVDLEADILGRMAFRPLVSPDLKVMDAALFREEPMGLKKGG